MVDAVNNRPGRIEVPPWGPGDNGEDDIDKEATSMTEMRRAELAEEPSMPPAAAEDGRGSGSAGTATSTEGA